MRNERGSHLQRAVIAERLTTQLWIDLLEGRIGILRLPHFISRRRCTAALDELNDDRFVVYDPIEEFGGGDPLSHSQIRSDYLAGSCPDEPPVSRRLGRTLYEHAATWACMQAVASSAGRNNTRAMTCSDVVSR